MNIVLTTASVFHETARGVPSVRPWPGGSSVPVVNPVSWPPGVCLLAEILTVVVAREPPRRPASLPASAAGRSE